MTFTYTPFSSDRDRVRWHIGDTNPDKPRLTDEEIDGLLTETGSVGEAVVSAIMHLIARLSDPNFRADWLQVDHASARKGFESLLGMKRRELGVSTGAGLTVTAIHTYRADSKATESPDYEAQAAADDD